MENMNIVERPYGRSVSTEIGEYNVRIMFDLEGNFIYHKSSCDCRGFSYHLQSKEHRKAQKICKHIEELITKLNSSEALKHSQKDNQDVV